MKIHMVSKGGLSKLHVCPHRGEEGQKYPKIHPHGLWMFPEHARLYEYVLLVFLQSKPLRLD